MKAIWRNGPVRVISVLALAGALGFGLTFTLPSGAQRAIDTERVQIGGLPSFAPLIERVGPAVVSVNVITRTELSNVPGSLPDDFDMEQLPPMFRDFFRDFQRNQPPAREGRSLGSGFFIDAEGHIVTNHHVVDGATEITVSMQSGDELKAKVIGSDQNTDLAVIKVERKEPFPFVKFADDAKPKVGDWVVAVGNPFGLGGTATAGIISAMGREGTNSYVDFIQTDASINRGNSGGPTFDLNGNVIGVNSMILSPTGGNVGIGLAIPADTAEQIIRQLIENGKITRGWLGVLISDLTEDLAMATGAGDAKGAFIQSVTENSPASKAGFEAGDVVLTIDGQNFDGSRELTRRVGGLRVDQKVKFGILRDGKRQTLNVTIAERPSESELNGTVSVDTSSDSKDYFGMSLRGLSAQERTQFGLSGNEKGLIVEGVEIGSPAARRGLSRGTLIMEANSTPVGTIAELDAAIADAEKTGKKALLLLIKQGTQTRYLAIPFEEN
jgi:serine protease Do